MLLNMENRTLAYFAGSLAVHLGVWAILQQMPVEDEGINVDFAINEAPTISARTIDHEDRPVKPEDEKDVADGGSTSKNSKAMELEQGTSGDKKSLNEAGHIRIKDNKTEPQLARDEAIQLARDAGLLGSVALQHGGFTSLTATGELSSGFDASDINGALFGPEGTSRGFGIGLHGFGPGGGCMTPPCGLIGTDGTYPTIGGGRHAGSEYRGPSNGPGDGPGHKKIIPDVAFGHPTGDYDKSIVRRYIRRHVAEISYCYEKQLLARPGIAGEILVQFMITPSGTVQTSTGTGFDSPVASCVAGVIKNIEFPKPGNGGSVHVNYPFTFHAAGAGQ